MRKRWHFTCANCGSSFESTFKGAKFCGRSCSSQYTRKHIKEKSEMKTRVIQCPNNEGVSCYADYCWKCGWNPAVAQRRLDKLLGKECAV